VPVRLVQTKVHVRGEGGGGRGKVGKDLISR